MASNLHNKINSYSIERGVEFSETYTLPPTRTGSLSQATDSSWSLSGNAPTYESTVGPIGGAGSWRFTNNTSTATGCRVNTTGLASRHNDEDYSSGLWVKFNSLPSGTGDIGISIHSVPNPVNNIGYTFVVSGSTHATNPSKIGIQAETAVNFASSVTVNTTDWYYLAIRRVDNEVKWYINGNLISTLTVTGTGTAANVIFGNTITTTTQDFNISNYYVATASEITATEIAEIWTAGSTLPVSVNYSADPMIASNAVFVDPITSGQAIVSKTPATASALMTEPTIIITSNDYTKITTSIIVSATFPSNISVVAIKNINFILATTFNASVELINNVTVSTTTDYSFSAAEFIASAQMLPAKMAEAPMIVSALMVNPSIFVTPSYFKMITESNPLFYFNFDKSTIDNYGSWGPVTEISSSGVNKNADSGPNLSLVGSGKSWFYPTITGGRNTKITFPNSATILNNLSSSNFSIEFWAKRESNLFRIDVGNIQIGNALVVTSLYKSVYNSPDIDIYDIPQNFIETNDWNHYVLTAQKVSALGPDYDGLVGNNYTYKVWTNGSLAATHSVKVRDLSIYNNPNLDEILISNEKQTFLSGIGADIYYDEFAIYDRVLTNAEIIDHFTFINNLSPNTNYYSTSFNAAAESNDHQFTVTSNVTAVATPITGSALFVNPAVLAVKNISNSATILTASATNTDVTVYYGWTIYPTPAIASAEMGPAYFLSSYYYQYIQSNFAPYRYVTFDSSAPYLDYGSDTDYSVANVVVNGTVVNPDFGINGKSVKSTGTYTNGAAILKESEHSDTWGTGNNSWHSAFWMRRALDDTSTGLRVLWNVNGYADNQYIIIYHYENKLHVQINSQNDSPITMTTTNNINIFDFQRHHIVLNSHHNNNNNILTLYVDGVQVATQNIGTYAITTTNGTPHTAPNDEINNLPRLGIGTLITPFGFTALPVVPSNISVYFDEIYWDKNQITLTEVVNQFNAMPDQNNETIVAEPFIASAQSVMPAISTQAILSVAPATASAEFVNPTLYIERFIINTANIMTASALMTEAAAFVPIQINADVMVASAIFDSAGIIISIPGQTMYATAKLTDDHAITRYTGAYSNTILVKFNTIYSTYVRYLVYKANNDNKIPRYKEIK